MSESNQCLTISTKHRECKVNYARREADGGVDIGYTDICFSGLRLSATQRFKLEKNGFLLIDGWNFYFGRIPGELLLRLS